MDEKKKRKLGSLLHLATYVLRHKLMLIGIITTVLTANVLALFIPHTIGEMVNTIDIKSGSIDFSLLGKQALLIVAIALISWLVASLQNVLMVTIGQKIVVDLRQDVFEKLEHLPVSYFAGTTKGNIMSIVITDISNVSDSITTDIITLITGLITVGGSLAFMLKISITLSAIFAVTIPALFIGTRIISKKSRTLYHDRKNSFGELCGYAEEMITAQKTIKIYGLEKYNHQKFCTTSKNLRDKGVKADFCSSMMMPFTNGINNLNFILICAISSFLALSGKITIGDISAFILYSKKFAGPIVNTSNIINTLQVSLAACDRIFSILNLSSEEEEDLSMETPLTEKPRGEITFDHVTFGYDTNHTVLKNINFHINPGQKIAIVGSTGAGKTTIVSLLLRFYKITGGHILLDGRDIYTIPLGQLRRCFSLIPQDSWLFEGTIYDNITYAVKPNNLSPESVKKLCREIGIDDFISSLPNGYNTLIRNDSSGLSQGQKQLVNIARAFLYNPSVFILDEATSSVDPQTEAKIQDVTNRVISGKTSIIIAHRLSTIVSADCILVLKDGQICGQGTHRELLAQNGLYKDIYESQFCTS